jgi:hypothetical protein
MLARVRGQRQMGSYDGRFRGAVGCAGAGSWWFRSAIAAVGAGIAAKLGFDQSGDGMESLPISFTTVPGSR